MVLWQWQVWRCFDEARELLFAKGWRLLGEVPLAAESAGFFLVFGGLDAETSECWFELRAGDGPPTVVLRGLEAVPTPAEAAGLLAERAAALRRLAPPQDRPLYDPATVPASTG